MTENELEFEIIIEKSADNVTSFTINEEEVMYILDQIKYNQPFVIQVDNSFFCYSPNNCIAIEIKPIK